MGLLDFFTAPVSSILSTVIGGLFQSNSAQAANIQNVQNQQEAQRFNAEQAGISRDFNAQQAELSRDFQAQQAGSVYQRSVADLSKAGLNPMLAYQQGGNPAGAGSAASSSPASSPGPAHVSPTYPVGLAQSALAAYKVGAEVELLRSQADRERAEADATRGYRAAQGWASAGLSSNQAEFVQRQVVTEIERAGLTEAERKLVEERAFNTLQDSFLKMTQRDTTRSQGELAQAETALANASRVLREAETGNVRQDTALKAVATKLEGLRIPGAEYESRYRGGTGYLGPILKDVGSAFGAARDAAVGAAAGKSALGGGLRLGR